MTDQPIRLGTRGSQLALYQANTVAHAITAAGGPRCDIVIIKTSGDQSQESPLAQIGGKRSFVKELEDALHRGDIDLAVHSSKDMPAVLFDGLIIAGVLPRADPHDAVVVPSSMTDVPRALDDLIAALGQSPRVGTSSVRRIAQLTRLMPHARFEPIRGNLDTRLRKLDTGQYDVLVLAAAGLRRLNLEARISATLPVSACVPSPGQGIIAIETRAEDTRVIGAVEAISDPVARLTLDAERAVVLGLGGGCQTPIGALATPLRDELLEIVAAVVALDGSQMVHTRLQGPREQATELGARAARDLLEQGAGVILEDAARTLAHNGQTSP